MPKPTPPLGTIERHLVEAFPREFIEALVGIFKQVYRDVIFSVGASLSGPRRNSVAGMTRWAIVEEEVLKLKGRFDGVDIVEVPGDGGHRHVEIRAGRFVLTVSYLKDRQKMVRPAQYRKGLARKWQVVLSPGLFDEQTVEPVGPEYYGIITHGPARTATSYDYMHVSYTAMAFPARDYSGYARDPINLLTLFGLSLAPEVITPTHEIPDDAKPRLRPGLGGATGTDDSNE